MKAVLAVGLKLFFWGVKWTLVTAGSVLAAFVLAYTGAALHAGETPFKGAAEDLVHKVASMFKTKAPRAWIPGSLPSDLNGPPKAGQYPAYSDRLDLAVAPRQDLFPAVRGDPEFAPQIDRVMVAGASSDLDVQPDPFQPGTRPASTEEESDDHHIWRH